VESFDIGFFPGLLQSRFFLSSMCSTNMTASPFQVEYFNCCSPHKLVIDGGSRSRARYFANSTSTLLRRSAPIMTRSEPMVEIIHRMSSPRHQEVSRYRLLQMEGSASYLSGLLVGHEVRAAMSPGTHVHVVGAARLCSLYGQAIGFCGGSSTLEDQDTAARGLAAIARRPIVDLSLWFEDALFSRFCEA
jgi:2-keto-3-deoxy-galactonokinase